MPYDTIEARSVTVSFRRGTHWTVEEASMWLSPELESPPTGAQRDTEPFHCVAAKILCRIVRQRGLEVQHPYELHVSVRILRGVAFARDKSAHHDYSMPPLAYKCSWYRMPS